MTLRLAAFDLDGTLVDSRKTITQAMGQAFAHVGLPDPGYEGTRQVVGLSLETACARIAPDDIAPEDLEALIGAFRGAFVAFRADPDFAEPLYPGGPELVATLEEAGWLLSVATGKNRRGIDTLFDRYPALGRAFTVIRCADDGPSKPHPHMLDDALAETGVDARDAVMIGDTSHDMAMARAAGVRAHGVTWGFHTPDEIRAAGAHAVHDDFACLERGLAAWAKVGV